MSIPLRVADFDYSLPAEQIAQFPSPERDRSRLLVIERATDALRHLIFSDLPTLLTPGDLLVINEAKVFPARLSGSAECHHGAEILLIQEIETGCWEALIKPSRKLHAGDRLLLADGAIEARVLEKRLQGRHLLHLAHDGDLRELLWHVGQMPLPPYIKRQGRGFRVQGSAKDHPVSADPLPYSRYPDLLDFERYQTVYARHDGAIAAPTAGLHFSPELIETLKSRGIAFAPITLYVGPGTFRPVRAEHVSAHRMESERYVIPEDTALAIKVARNDGRRVIAVGTTTVRALEHAAIGGELQAGAGVADLFIYPGYRFKMIDALITNFHLPRSTLLILVSAFAGRDAILAAYREAIAGRYRFYSYGDAMLIV